MITTEPKSPERTALYRLYDAEDDLLYVGITVSPCRRWREHKRDRRDTWWPRVARRTVEWFDSRPDARRAEVQAIRLEAPEFNVLHSESAPPTPQTVFPRTPGFGDASLALIRERFGRATFTTLDLFAAGSRSKAGAEQHIRALRHRGLIVPIGRRSNAPRTGKRHVLYVLADSPLASTKTPRLERDNSPARSSPEASPTAASWALLTQALQLFGAAPFTISQLTESGNASRAAVRRHAARLEHWGYLEITGVRVAPARGHPSLLYRVARKPPTTTEPGCANTPASSTS